MMYPNRFLTVRLAPISFWEELIMHSQEYLDARKEFINCIVLSPICLFVPLVLAFTEWYPIMRRERRKEAEQAKNAQ